MFDWLFKWIGSFLKKVARTTVGIVADKMERDALAVVRTMEQSNLSGTEKANKAFDELKKRHPSFESAAVNLAIEAAVAIVKDELRR